MRKKNNFLCNLTSSHPICKISDLYSIFELLITVTHALNTYTLTQPIALYNKQKYTHIHTISYPPHTHTERERERERGTLKVIKRDSCVLDTLV